MTSAKAADDKALQDRIERLEQFVANTASDHIGWLLALQAISAVLLVRQLAIARNPDGFIEEAKTWSRSVVESTQAAPTITPETAEKMRDIAFEKIDRFFDGISIRETGNR
jgi:hypothetical protein